MHPEPQNTFWRPSFALALLASLLFPCAARAALPVDTIEQWAVPHVERYPPRTTRIGDPVTSIAMMPRGEIAFLSESQFTVFDGTQWTTIDGLSRPTQLVTVNGDQILVGQPGGIKRLHPNVFGSYDLEDLYGEQSSPNSHVSHRYLTSARGHIFGIHGTQLTLVAPDGSLKIHELDSWASTLFSIEDEVYFTGGTTALLNRWDWENEQLVDCQQALDDTAYVWFTEVKERTQGGVWLLNQNNQIVGYDGSRTWFWKGNEEIKRRGSSIQTFVEVAPDTLAIATNSEGVIIFDSDGNVTQQISKEHGLDDVSALGVGIDPQDGLWISTKRSVSRIQLNPNALVFDERHGLNESVEAIAICNDRLYLATPSGLYVNNPDARSMKESFLLRHRISDITDILSHRGKLFVAAANLVMIDENDQATELSPDGATNLWQPSGDEDLVLAGNYKGVIACRYQDGKWGSPKQLPGPEREVFGFAESNDGSLLTSLGNQEFGIVTLEGENERFEVRTIPTPMNGAWSMVATVRGDVYLNSVPGMRWNSKTDAWVTSPEMVYYVGDVPFGFEQVFGTSDRDAWVCINPRRGETVKRPNREVIGQISQINDGIETRADAIIYDSQGRAWIGGDFGLVLSPRPNSTPPELESAPAIHRLLSMKDGQLLSTVGGEDGTLRLEASQNSLRIEAQFSQYLGADKNQMQIFIEGLDAEWPGFTNVAFRKVTNLSPGKYTLIVNARNAYGQTASYSLPIAVAKPFYLTPIAIVSYLLAALLTIAGIAYLYSRQQIRKSRRLQTLVDERTQELASKNTVLEEQAIRLESQNEELEEKTEELTATTETLTTTLNQLQEMQDQLVATARTAGKAEIAINVLHNVGNVLNSLNVSVNVLSQRTQDSNASKLSRLAGLIQQHRDSVADFIANDPRGKNVPEYLIQLSKTLEEEIAENLQELGVMNDDIDHIKSVIAAQQTHAKSESVIEEVRLSELCQTALNIIGDERCRKQVEIVNKVPQSIVVENDKHRLLDILLNLISNAFDAIHEQAPEIGTITLRAKTAADNEEVAFTITDNGSGIAPEDQEKLFRHGFTTKAQGHGFGLHSSANAANVLGGQLTLTSPGKGRGATATLTLPTSNKAHAL